ncbi:MAG TPA: hypothetical protein PKL71_08245 [Marmoricola sp.]|nr:hypothetical protein [Marmoricola sp.]
MARRRAPRKLHQRRRLRVNKSLAAVGSGLVAGVVATALYYAAEQGCHWLLGPGGCGGIGFASTIVVLLISGAAGAGVIRWLGQRDPVTVAYLGIALLTVVVMFTVIRQLDSVWMVAVIPVLTAGCFLASAWLISIVNSEET